MTGAGEAAGAPAAKGKGAPKGAAVEQIVLEEGDADLTETCINNFMVGDIIEQVVCLNNDPKLEVKRPKMPHYLNLKLCLVGYAFAGKKT